MTVHTFDRSYLRSRYRFTGTLVLDTALHIGGGRESSTVTDSPILRDSVGRPVIPGSSIKGAFRAGVERLLPNLPGFNTCALNNASECLSMNDDLSKAYRKVSEAASQGSALGMGSSQMAEEGRAALKALNREAWAQQELNETYLLDLLAEYLCDTCKTFGSVHLAAAARFHDLPVKDWDTTTQIRDGVGIDRDSERAVDQIKFDYEVVPAQTRFVFSLTLENPTPRDQGLIALGLQEFVNGMIPLGGIRSRGLGRCHLENVEVEMVDFSLSEALTKYLQSGQLEAVPLEDFIRQSMAALLPA